MAAILYIRSIFPRKEFANLLPPVILKHQVYCVVKDKTLVDRELNKLWQERKLQLFKLISGSDEFAVVLMDDFIAHINMQKDAENTSVLEKFLESVLPRCVDVSVSTKGLNQEHKLNEKEISALVNNGLLQCRDVGSWWLGIPGAGVFMKHFTKGRKNILKMIRKRKFKEILQRDLENYKVNSKLGIQYHIYDIIGAEYVKRCFAIYCQRSLEKKLMSNRLKILLNEVGRTPPIELRFMKRRRGILFLLNETGLFGEKYCATDLK